jgi:hypothetical protein
MRRAAAVAFAMALSLFAGGASAQAVAARGGTTGFGGDLGFSVTDHLGVRGTLTGGSITRNTTESDVHYEGKLRFRTAMALLDFFPAGGRFRLSTGIAYNGNRLDLTARGDSGTIEINDRTYNISDVGVLTGKLRFNKANPYFGVGWGNAAKSGGPGVFFSADLGILLVDPTVTLSANCGPALTPAQCAQLQSDLRAEEQQFKDDYGYRSWYPVLSFGIGYRF